MLENIQEIINELHRMKKEYNAPQGCCVRTQERNGYRSKCLSIAIKALSEVQTLAKAKADGRLVVLPCKVGTRVWVIGQDCDLCHDMYTEEPCLFGDCEYKGVFESIFSIGMTDKFGKTVFLTREEAEKALSGDA